MSVINILTLSVTSSLLDRWQVGGGLVTSLPRLNIDVVQDLVDAFFLNRHHILAPVVAPGHRWVRARASAVAGVDLARLLVCQGCVGYRWSNVEVVRREVGLQLLQKDED